MQPWKARERPRGKPRDRTKGFKRRAVVLRRAGRGHRGARLRRPRGGVRDHGGLRPRRRPHPLHLAPHGRGYAPGRPRHHPAQRPRGRDAGSRGGHARADAEADGAGRGR